MANKALKALLAKKLHGVGTDRIAVRAQGCWNCIHGGEAGFERAAKLWWDKARGDTLARGVQIATSSPLGEQDERVKNVRAMVPQMDVNVERKQWVTCSTGKDPSGNPVADFVHHTYLCSKWTGAVGASVAREGEKLDKLPEELMEDFTKDGKTE